MFYDVYERLCYQHGEKPYSLPVKLGLMKKNTAIANWKNGSTPRANTVQALAEYFGVSVPYLLDMQEKPSVPEGEGLDPLDMEALNLFSQLWPDNRKHLLEIAQSLLKAQEVTGGQNQSNS